MNKVTIQVDKEPIKINRENVFNFAVFGGCIMTALAVSFLGSMSNESQNTSTTSTTNVDEDELTTANDNFVIEDNGYSRVKR